MLKIMYLLMVILLSWSGCTTYEKIQRKPQLPITYQSTLPERRDLGLLISEFATPITNNDVIRNSNLVTAVRHLSGSEIKPHQGLSFKQLMGGFKPGSNFQQGRWLANNKPDGIPEGVEQVATTFYMAVNRAGLAIEEGELVRKEQPWAPTDGQVLITENRDLRVLNPFDYPVHIYGQVTSNSIIIGIYQPR